MEEPQKSTDIGRGYLGHTDTTVAGVQGCPRLPTKYRPPRASARPQSYMQPSDNS